MVAQTKRHAKLSDAPAIWKSLSYASATSRYTVQASWGRICVSFCLFREGRNYDEFGLLACRVLRPHFGPIRHLFWDWLHVCICSTGIFQTVSNDIISALITAGAASLEELDTYHREHLVPNCGRALKPDFFAQRHQSEQGGHLRGFASEMLLAIKTLCAFQPDGLARGNVRFQQARGWRGQWGGRGGVIL
jgi:hypothetical protein